MSAKYIEIIRNSLMEDVVVAEDELKRHLLDKDTKPKKRIKNIKKAIEAHKGATLNLTFWEDYVQKNIVTPESRITNNPDEGNEKT